MIDCRNCINWIDGNLEEIEAGKEQGAGSLMGCRIYGVRDGKTALESCPHYHESDNLFTICRTCKITVPKVCVSLGECVNCLDTDLFCVDSCIGGDLRKYCTHFIRLYTEGAHLIDQGRTFDLFPILGMPGGREDAADFRSEDEPHPAEDRKPKATSQMLSSRRRRLRHPQ